MNHTRARCDQKTIHPRVPASTLKLNPDSKRKRGGQTSAPERKAGEERLRCEDNNTQAEPSARIPTTKEVAQ